MKRWLTTLASLAVALPLAVVAYAPPAGAAAHPASHHWVVSDYRCTHLPPGNSVGITLCAVRQKAAYAGATHYRSRLTITPEAGHWAIPEQLVQRDLTSQHTRNVCGTTACSRKTTRWIGPWFGSGTAQQVDGWTVASDSGPLTIVSGHTAPLGSPAARAAVRCVTTSSGRICNRFDVMLA